MNGKQLKQMAIDTFGTDQITEEQMGYVLDMLVPSNYMLRNHTIKGQPMTFRVSNRDRSQARSHRPWQVDIVNDSHHNLAVMKSRQLGLNKR